VPDKGIQVFLTGGHVLSNTMKTSAPTVNILSINTDNFPPRVNLLKSCFNLLFGSFQGLRKSWFPIELGYYSSVGNNIVQIA
jgi:hypothetical protein